MKETSKLKILILARRFRSNQSEADEHDFVYNKKTLESFNNPLHSNLIKYDLFSNYKEYLNWEPSFVFFLGFNPQALEIKKKFKNSKFGIWAKCYSSSIKDEFKNFFEELDIIFDSCFFNIFSEKKNYFYLPTAIHKNFKYKIIKNIYLSLYRKKLINQVKKFDIIFSGSPRFNRRDNYRQELINILLKKGIKILICSPKRLWFQSNFKVDTIYQNNLSFSEHNYWATKDMYKNAKFVLDLPWLDTIIPELENKFDPQFALGWNIFRSGFHGSNLITYDCEMNRSIGLNSQNCSFYKSNVEKLPNLANEIEYIIKNTDKNKIQYNKTNLKKHFNNNHSYDERWKFIITKLEKINNY